MEFIRYNLGSKDFLVPNPTWGTHHSILKKSNLNFVSYPYYDEKTRGINFSGMTTALKNAQPGIYFIIKIKINFDFLLIKKK